MKFIIRTDDGLREIEIVSHSFYVVNGEKTEAISFVLANGTTTVISPDMISEKITNGELVGYEPPAEEMNGLTDDLPPEPADEPEEPTEEEKPKKKGKK